MCRYRQTETSLAGYRAADAEIKTDIPSHGYSLATVRNNKCIQT
jgi:hypothetical protein